MNPEPNRIIIVDPKSPDSKVDLVKIEVGNRTYFLLHVLGDDEKEFVTDKFSWRWHGILSFEPVIRTIIKSDVGLLVRADHSCSKFIDETDIKEVFIEDFNKYMKQKELKDKVIVTVL